jgi:hypothetical protein
MDNEFVLYQPDDSATKFEVRLENDTIWLTQAQIVQLFESSKANISEHIKHIYQSKELVEHATVRNFRTVRKEGNRTIARELIHYNLDMIISIGYRVNSLRGTQFRIWATNVLKDYLLKGYAVNNRMNRLEDKVDSLNAKINQIDLQINTHLIPTQGVFFEGQVFDAYELASKIIRSATKSIYLIDNYIDESTLTQLSKKNKNVFVTLLTKNKSKQLLLDVKKANEQYGNFELKTFNKSHDRFLIIDETTVYHLGASLKDLGKKWFAFTKMDNNSVENILNSIKK